MRRFCLRAFGDSIEARDKEKDRKLKSTKLKVRDAVRNLPDYVSPRQGKNGLRLDLNENTAGCSPRVLARLREFTAEEVSFYRDREGVETLVAAHLGIDASELLLTNGVDEAIHLLCEAFLEPSDEVLLPTPTFDMYEICAAATGANVVAVRAQGDFSFPASALLDRISASTRLIPIANPNNPTGMVADPSQLLEIARRAPHSAVLIDEAYFEFYGKTLMGCWGDHPNIFVSRTFSKAYGLAGLRAGVLTGDRDHIGHFRRLASPFNMNTAALACLPVALEDSGYLAHCVRDIRKARETLRQALAQWEIYCFPSEANFVFAQLGQWHSSFVESLQRRGFLVRDRSRDPGCEGCVRITVGTCEQTNSLIQAIDETFSALGVKREAKTFLPS